MRIISATTTLKKIDWDFTGVKTNHSTHSLHPYPAKYIPQIPAALIRELSNRGEIVADIFCGSGTTLVEALSLGRNAIGIDANPLACLISEAKTTKLSLESNNQLKELIDRANDLAGEISLKSEGLFAQQGAFVSKAPRPDSDTLNFWFESFVIEEIAEILSWCNSLTNNEAQTVSKVALSSIIVAASKQDSDTRYVRREKNISPGEVLRKFARALGSAVTALSDFNQTVPSDVTCKIYNESVLSKPDIGSIDLVVCSPPYPNAFSYHLYHMTRMLWLSMDQPKFKREEIGSHRKYSSKGQNGATVETFRQEMRIVFDWLRRHLKNDRYVCFVVGNSTIRGESVNNAELISTVANEHDFCEVDRLNRNMQATKKAFNPAHGRIKTEQIVILQKISK